MIASRLNTRDEESVPESVAELAADQSSAAFGENFGAFLERWWIPCWILFSLVYFLLAFSVSRRMLWYDELFTSYLSAFPLPRLWQALLAGVDQNGPAFYLFSAFTQKLASNPDLGLRIPAILGGWFMLGAIFLYVRRRCSTVYAWAAVLFAMDTHACYYTVEARPYGMVMGCCALSFFAWHRATESRRRGWSLALLAVSLMTAGLVHAYSILLFVPLSLGELARTVRRRTVDWTIWAVFAGAGLVYAAYIPIAAAVHGSLKYTWARPDPDKIPESYAMIFAPMWVLLLAIILLLAAHSLLLPASRRWTSTEPAPGRLPQHEAIALMALTLLPFAGLALGRFTGIFTPRYVIECVAGLAIVFAVVLFRAAGGRSAFAVAVCLLSLTWEVWGFFDTAFKVDNPDLLKPLHESPHLVATYELLPKVERSSLPLVVSSGLMFLEIDHYATPELAARLHLLIDRDAAIQHTRVDLFENGLPLMSQWFPLRGQLDQYSAFLSSHPHFLVYGFWDSRQANDWLLYKLLKDGAKLQALGHTDRGWKLPMWDSRSGDSRYLYLFDVTIPTASAPGLP
jgi:hypothetical protein